MNRLLGLDRFTIEQAHAQGYFAVTHTYSQAQFPAMEKEVMFQVLRGSTIALVEENNRGKKELAIWRKR